MSPRRLRRPFGRSWPPLGRAPPKGPQHPHPVCARRAGTPSGRLPVRRDLDTDACRKRSGRAEGFAPHLQWWHVIGARGQRHRSYASTTPAQWRQRLGARGARLVEAPFVGSAAAPRLHEARAGGDHHGATDSAVGANGNTTVRRTERASVGGDPTAMGRRQGQPIRRSIQREAVARRTSAS